MIQQISSGLYRPRPVARTQDESIQDTVCLSGGQAAGGTASYGDASGARVSHSVKIRQGQLHYQVSVKAQHHDQIRRLSTESWQLLEERTGFRGAELVGRWLSSRELVGDIACRGMEVRAARTGPAGELSASCHYADKGLGSVTRDLEVSSDGAVTESVRLSSAPEPHWRALQPGLATVERLCQVDLGAYFRELFPEGAIGPGSVQIKGKEGEAVVDFSLMEGGREVGSMVRSFKRGTVHHDFFRLTESKQGAGLAKRILRRSVAFYERFGFESVDLLASLGVGGYAWAKYGFTPVDEAEKANLSRRIRGRLGELELAPPVKAVVNHLLEDRDPKSLWTLADLAMPVEHRGVTTKLGQALLLGQTWTGRLDLHDAEARQRFAQYVGEEN